MIEKLDEKYLFELHSDTQYAFSDNEIIKKIYKKQCEIIDAINILDKCKHLHNYNSIDRIWNTKEEDDAWECLDDTEKQIYKTPQNVMDYIEKEKKQIKKEFKMKKLIRFILYCLAFIISAGILLLGIYIIIYIMFEKTVIK